MFRYLDVINYCWSDHQKYFGVAVPRVLRIWEGMFLPPSVFFLTLLPHNLWMHRQACFYQSFLGSWQFKLGGSRISCCDLNCLFESHSNLQTSCSKECLFNIPNMIAVMKSFASNQQPIQSDLESCYLWQLNFCRLHIILHRFLDSLLSLYTFPSPDVSE